MLLNTTRTIGVDISLITGTPVSPKPQFLLMEICLTVERKCFFVCSEGSCTYPYMIHHSWEKVVETNRWHVQCPSPAGFGARATSREGIRTFFIFGAGGKTLPFPRTQWNGQKRHTRWATPEIDFFAKWTPGAASPQKDNQFRLYTYMVLCSSWRDTALAR
jgi:hypothetical protein